MVEREEVEENNMIRLGGRQKLIRRRRREMGQLGDIAAFDVSRGLVHEAGKKSAKSGSMREKMAAVRKARRN